MEKVIAYDFGGVLDVKDAYTKHDSNINFRVIKQTDVKLAILLLNFALKNNVKIMSISDLSMAADINRCIFKAICNTEIPEFQDIALEMKEKSRDFRKLFVRPDLEGKQKGIDSYLKFHKNVEILAFEDSVDLKNCEQVWVYNRLQESHIETAQAWLDK